ncbi:MAG TPA: hypothetical protein VLY04_06610 [Bryobacteraceae bacterium]|nr:hypothetical protein [Bryobacteraceae bacterium]
MQALSATVNSVFNKIGSIVTANALIGGGAKDAARLGRRPPAGRYGSLGLA